MLPSADPVCPRPLEGKENRPISNDAEERFRQIFESYHHGVRKYFLRRGFDEEDSRDLTQDTFLRVYKGMEALREAQKPKSWVYTVASNVYKNELRSRQTEKRSGEEVSLDAMSENGQWLVPVDREGPGRPPDPGPLHGVLEDERCRLLHDALTGLPDRMRQCVQLRLDQDLKYKDIATLMGVSVETVKAQLFQARKRLQEILKDHFENIEF